MFFSRRKEQRPLLPQSFRTFLWARYNNLWGIFLFSCSAFLGLALYSYVPSDPSFNTVGTADVQNWMGYSGAYIADFLIQMLGLSSTVLVLAFAFWGRLRFLQKKLSPLVLKLTCCIGAIFSFCLFSSLYPVADFWHIHVGPSGVLGLVLQNALFSIVQVPPWIMGGISFIFFVLFMMGALGLKTSEYLSFIKGSFRLFRGTGRILGKGLKAFHRDLYAPERIHEQQITSSRDLPQLIPKSNTQAVPPKIQGVNYAESVDIQLPEETKRPAERTSKVVNTKTTQAMTDLSLESAHQLPSLDLLAEPDALDQAQLKSRKHIKETADLLQSVLEDFGVKGRIEKARPGPVVTLYELIPAAGVKSSRVIGLADDIARSMSAVSARVAVIPGRNAIGIEVPNETRATVYLREMIESSDYEKTRCSLPFALGKDIGGRPVIADLARMPHLLVAGTTGSGKSVAINTMILSLLYRLSPQDCKLIMVDPKMLELSVYDGIPHLLTPVVTDPRKAVVALKWAVREMENRYQAMSKLGVRNIEGYNQRVRQAKQKGETLKRRVQTGFDPETGRPVFEDQNLPFEPLPFIVVIVDEMADLMLVAGKDVEATIQRLAQMARAAGIHLVMATQRPSVDVITGTIKANFPTRISFYVSSKIDSRTILGEQGAEQLLGQGDMLYLATGGKVTRVHGPFVSDGEVESIVNYLKSQGEPEYIQDITDADETAFGEESIGGKPGNSGDELYDRALMIVARHRKASTSFVQRHLQIGYNRAARLIERMEEEGVISAANHVGRREVLLPPLEETA